MATLATPRVHPPIAPSLPPTPPARSATQAPSTPPDTAAPLGPQHLAEIADARVRAAKIRRAASVATLSGWTLGFFAGCTALGVVFGDISSGVIALCLGIVAAIELRGASQIKAMNVNAPRMLAYNQLALAAVIVAYAGWSLWNATHTSPLASVGSTGDPDMDDMINGLNRTVSYGVYGLIALAGLLGPGLTALYYASRTKLIRAFLSSTPPWVVETLRAAG